QFERFLICMLKHCLLEAEKSDLLVKEYLGINVDSFMHYLEGKHNDHKVSYIYSDMLGEADRVFSKDADKLIKKEMNIGDYLKSTLETERQTWSCWKDIKEYENTIISANEMDRKLLLDSLSLGFRERMNVDDLLERYSVQDDLQIDYWEDCEDFFEGGEKDGENN
ncbi:MAG: hypothetical protein K6F99_05575, partial [Lachnospiraceae bacterium]|nr:hypothetical protein [Lachnospiraceae bacterium]